MRLPGLHTISLMSLLCAAAPAQQLRLHTYSVRDGLPSNTILTLYQDSRGFLWIGTNNGLSVYDGASFKNYSVANGMSNNWITGISESRTTPGRMWVGTIAGGLNALEQGTWSIFSIDTSQPGGDYVGSLAEDFHGNLWCSSRFAVFVLNETGLTRTIISEGAVEIALTPDSLIWVATSRRLYAFDRSPSSFHEVPVPLEGDRTITALSPGSWGTVWLGLSDSSLVQVRGSVVASTTKLRLGIPSRIISNKGTLLVRTTDNITMVIEADPEIQKPLQYRNENGIPPGAQLPILFDRENNLWIGSWLDGLHKIADRSFIHIPLDGLGAAVNELSAIADSNGHLWVGSTGGVWEFYQGTDGEWKRAFHPLTRGKLNNPVQIDSLNRLWVAVRGDLAEIHCYERIMGAHTYSRLSHLQTMRRQIDYPITPLRFYVDRAGNAWIAAAGAGIVVLDVRSRKTLARYPPTESLRVHYVTAMYHDPEDRMWIGTFNDGLHVIQVHDGQLIRRLTKADGLPGNEIRSIFRDSEGQMWIGTRHNGLALAVSGGFRTLSMRHGLASNAIWAIREDTQGRLWLQTDVGVVAIDRKALTPLPPKPELMGEVVNVFGIHKDEFLWVKGPGGLTIMEFSEESRDLTPPIVHIQTFEASGEPFSPEREIELAYHQNTLSIEYVGISLGNERGVRYRYRMLGIDTNWTEPTSQRRVTYAALNPRSYTFQVEAINGDGIPSVQPASVSFVVIPPFWQRWWFMSLALAAVSAILWTLYQYRIKKILEMERLRVRIAGDLHDDVGTNLSSIQIASQIMERQASLSEQDRTQLKEIGAIATSTQELMRDIVWMLNPKNDTLDDFLLKMKEVAARLLQDVRYTFIAPGGNLLDKVSIEFKRNIFLIFKEALNNIVRHAAATEAVIRVEQSGATFSLEIRDNGKGFDANVAATGNGLTNIRRRAEQIGGSIEITSKKGEGTVVSLSVKNHANA
jgi:signal transduction histidine kinase/ligand-binding sensor domain-containing protein